MTRHGAYIYNQQERKYEYQYHPGMEVTFEGDDKPTAMFSYIRRIPQRNSELPPGKVAVHNCVLWSGPGTKLGLRGFRAWLDDLTEECIPCECGWAPRLTVHYRFESGE
jgi:hypothetical protein